jgi:aminoglycoside phosphotransferase (APT) family kinase protein
VIERRHCVKKITLLHFLCQMGRQDDLTFMTDRLRRWALEHVAPTAQVASVERLPGHSSITLAFDVRHAGGLEQLVLRVVPAGVPRSGSTDVLRQVPLLRLMEAEGVPVPRVRWHGEDPSWFGVDHLIVDRVPGATLGDLFEAGGAARPAGDPERLFAQAVDALAAIHHADWRGTLHGWDEPRGLDHEIDRWLPMLRKAADPHAVDRGDWLTAALRVRARLHAGRPADPDPGVVHGDFYSNNWMFDGGRLSAVLDWETAVIGAQELDLGWLCMMYDPGSWSPGRRPDLA